MQVIQYTFSFDSLSCHCDIATCVSDVVGLVASWKLRNLNLLTVPSLAQVLCLLVASGCYPSSSSMPRVSLSFTLNRKMKPRRDRHTCLIQSMLTSNAAVIIPDLYDFEDISPV